MLWKSTNFWFLCIKGAWKPAVGVLDLWKSPPSTWAWMNTTPFLSMFRLGYCTLARSHFSGNHSSAWVCFILAAELGTSPCWASWTGFWLILQVTEVCVKVLQLLVWASLTSGVLPVSLLRVCCVSPCQQLVKLLSNVGPSTRPLGALLVTAASRASCCQLVFEPGGPANFQPM